MNNAISVSYLARLAPEGAIKKTKRWYLTVFLYYYAYRYRSFIATIFPFVFPPDLWLSIAGLGKWRCYHWLLLAILDNLCSSAVSIRDCALCMIVLEKTPRFVLGIAVQTWYNLLSYSQQVSYTHTKCTGWSGGSPDLSVMQNTCFADVCRPASYAMACPTIIPMHENRHVVYYARINLLWPGAVATCILRFFF